LHREIQILKLATVYSLHFGFPNFARRIASCGRSNTFDSLFFFCFHFCFRAGNRLHQTPRPALQNPNNEESANGAEDWSIAYLRRPKRSTIFSQTTNRRS